MISQSKASVLANKWFACFFSLELICFCFNRDVYFQLSGFYLFLLASLFVGGVVVVKNIKRIHINSNTVALIVLLLQVGLTTLLHIDAFESGYLFTYVIVLLLFLEVVIVGVGARFQRFILESYVLGAVIIALLQIVFRTRYYEMTASRITIQVFSNPKIDPNYLAAFMVAPFFLSVFYMIQTNKRGYKLLFSISALLVLLGIFLSGSRGALLAVVIGGLVSVFYLNKKKINPKFVLVLITLLVIGVVLVWRFIPKETIARFFSMNYLSDSGNIRRLKIWENAWQAIKKSPILGHGIQNSMYITGSITGLFEPAHNTFFDIWLQTGIIGLICVMILSFNAFKTKNPFFKGICVSTLICSVFIGAEACLFFWINLLICVSFSGKYGDDSFCGVVTR